MLQGLKLETKIMLLEKVQQTVMLPKILKKQNQIQFKREQHPDAELKGQERRDKTATYPEVEKEV